MILFLFLTFVLFYIYNYFNRYLLVDIPVFEVNAPFLLLFILKYDYPSCLIEVIIKNVGLKINPLHSL